MENKTKSYEVMLRVTIGPEEDCTIDDILNFQELEDCSDIKITVMAMASPCFDMSFFDKIGHI